MKVVVDTNVLVSALLTPGGACSDVLDLLLEGLVLPCIDGRIVAEYEDALRAPLSTFTATQVNAVLEMMREDGEWAFAPRLSVRVPHLADLPFLEVATATDSILITGNKRHFPKRCCGSVIVLSPREFLDLFHRS